MPGNKPPNNLNSCDSTLQICPVSLGNNAKIMTYKCTFMKRHVQEGLLLSLYDMLNIVPI